MKRRVITENSFELQSINKYASLMAHGNGFLGLRAAHEEEYPEQKRGMYVAGIYNRATDNEPSELVNLPDLAGMKIELDGVLFSLQSGEILSYQRELNLETGELKRELLWKNKENARFHFVFQRLVSKSDRHLMASRVTVISLDKTVQLKMTTGINAQETNFGRQHLSEERIRVYEEKVMQGVYQTTESGQTIVLTTILNGPIDSKSTFTAKNRQLNASIVYELQTETRYSFEKISTIWTSLDTDHDPFQLESAGYELACQYADWGYERLLEQSALLWKTFWKQNRIEVSSRNEFDQTALDFALYHLEVMTPAHDERISVGAKGLTGEGYKGHVFWDTEIFILPFHLFTEPETAKKLLRYRYLHLEQAKDKAEQNGYAGALFPWESAFTGEEETPEYAAINIRTGTRQKVASAIAEHHIVADIAFAVVKYYENTNDDAFMEKEGLTLLKETGRFWISRTIEQDGQLFIKDVIGPDEYTEHVDNNAYTNYMAYYNVEKAMYYMERFGYQDDSWIEAGRDFLNRLYLPAPNKDKIIPQDDTFLSKSEIDLSKYKKHQGSQGILLDYSRQEVNEMQILKQADVVMLMYLFPALFPKDVVMKNLVYYEARTIHDSSLSKAIHAIVAARSGELHTAYQFFQEACLIDLGPDPHSSVEGIHAASLGSLWLTVIFGFANLSTDSTKLSLSPKLPEAWFKLSFSITYRGRRLRIKLTHQLVEIVKETGPSLQVVINGESFEVDHQLKVHL